MTGRVVDRGGETRNDADGDAAGQGSAAWAFWRRVVNMRFAFVSNLFMDLQLFRGFARWQIREVVTEICSRVW
jgi:hypothetical protein